LSFVGAYWIFSGVVVVGMIFLFFTLPETKDKQLEEVETLFETPWCVCGKSGSFEINLSSITHPISRKVIFFEIFFI
jgi:hypothetical protein